MIVVRVVVAILKTDLVQAGFADQLSEDPIQTELIR